MSRRENMSSRSTTEVVKSIYHEKQVGNFCAIHAANNLVGEKTFTVEDFESIKEELNIFEEEPNNVCHRICKSIFSVYGKCFKPSSSKGNFDANVLMSALYKTKKIKLKFWDNRNKNIDELILQFSEETCTGCIINLTGNDNCLMSCFTKCLSLCFRANGHWIAIKKERDGKIYNLNSSFPNGPVQINKNEEQLKLFFMRQIKLNNHILLATMEEGNKDK